MVAKEGRTLAAARPVAASRVLARRESPAVGLRAGEDVVHVRRVIDAVDRLALLGERGLLREVVVGRVQLLDALRDDHALGVLPRSAADAVACIDAAGPSGAEVSVPG